MKPGANLTSNEALEEYIPSESRTFYHPSGTCKMGPRGLGGVVDDQLRVYGVQGLRVVDASVIPKLPAAHLMATVFAIAEKVRSLSEY